MPIYEYKCPTCGPFETLSRADSHLCPHCGDPSRRVFSWKNATMLHDHYNPAFGQVISSRRQAAELARKASDDQSERLGMTVNYELTDLHDHEAAGIDKTEKTEYAGRTKEARGW